LFEVDVTTLEVDLQAEVEGGDKSPGRGSGAYLICMASNKMTPFCSANSCIFKASSVLVAMGFSTSIQLN
jgi:hypothetical protein